MYKRVVPRDLLNEARLLNCMGRLAMLVHAGLAPSGLTYKASGGQFVVDRHVCDGAYYVRDGLYFLYDEWELELEVPFEAQQLYPLVWFSWHGRIRVFNETGDFTDEFLDKIRYPYDPKELD